MFVADAGYWSTDNASLAVSAEVLIAPVPATRGITDRRDPHLAERRAVLARLHAGKISVRRAAKQMGVSETWARELLRAYRSDGPDPAAVRAEMEDRLASEAGAASYAKRKITVEPVFGNIQANLRFRRFPAEASRPSPANGDSSAPPTTSSSSNATSWPSPDRATDAGLTPPGKSQTPQRQPEATTENPATASHLHFRTRSDSKRTDPVTASLSIA